MNFAPVRTLADLDTLDEAEIVEGYRTAQRGDPEPGPNRGRSFWHGWRNRMIDYRELPMDEASEQLGREFLTSRRRPGHIRGADPSKRRRRTSMNPKP